MIAEQLDLFKKNFFKNSVPQIDTCGKIFVNGYRRRNGTYVQPYWRKSPRRQIGSRRNFAVSNALMSLF